MDYILSPTEERLLAECKQKARDEIKDYSHIIGTVESLVGQDFTDFMKAFDDSDFCEMGKIFHRQIDDMLVTEAKEEFVGYYD